MAEKVNLRAVITGVDQISPSLRKIQINANNTITSLLGIGAAMRKNIIPAAIMGRAGTAFVKQALWQFATVAGAAQNASQQIGIAGEQLTALSYAADQSGVSTESLYGSLNRLNVRLGEVAAGRGAAYADTFKEFGIEVFNSSGEVRTAAELFADVAEIIKNTKNPVDRATIAYQAFGRSGQALLPLLQEGKAGIKSWGEEARKLGVVLTDEDLLKADQLSDAMAKMKTATQGLYNSIGVNLAPTITRLIHQFTDWLARNRAIISSGITRVVEALGRAFAGIDVNKIFTGIEKVVTATAGWVDKLGGVYNILKIIAGFFVAKFVVDILAGLTKIRAGFIATNLVASTGPVGLVLAAIAAAGTAAYFGGKHLKKKKPRTI